MVSLKKSDFELLNVDWKNIISINSDSRSKEESDLEDGNIQFMFI